MSVRQTYIITCNGDGCRELFIMASPDAPSQAGQIRSVALTKGWYYGPGGSPHPSGAARSVDLCPGCSTSSAVVS